MTKDVALSDRLEGLLISPKEKLDVEIKSWLDLSDKSEKAVLAKALIAMANHGGGYVIIGLKDPKNTGVFSEAPGRPDTLNDYSDEIINSVVNLYCVPNFHCEVHLTICPNTQMKYPIIKIPGISHIPVRTKKESPESDPKKKTFKANEYYIRKPGPMSETPREPSEWDALIKRCVISAKEEMINAIRTIITGELPNTKSTENIFEEWNKYCISRWEECIKKLPLTHPARFVNGRLCFAYRIVGDFSSVDTQALLSALSNVKSYSGWPMFINQNRLAKPQNRTIECWLGGTNSMGEYADFWIAKKEDNCINLFLIRGFQEDYINLQPGSYIEVTVPIWRAAELILHAKSLVENLHQQLGSSLEVEFDFYLEWDGLINRALFDESFGQGIVHGSYIAKQEGFSAQFNANYQTLNENLPELVYNQLKPFYEIFDFFKLEKKHVDHVFTKMLK